MYTKNKIPTTTINKKESPLEGETIEQKVRRIMNNGEPITDGAPILFTDRRDGVKPEYDIRTDRFEIAIEATDHITKQHLAKREGKTKLGNDKTGKEAQEGMKKEGGATSDPVETGGTGA